MPTASFVQELIIRAKDETGALQNVKTNVQGLATETQKADQVMAAVGNTTTKTQSSFQKLGSSMKSNAGSITAVTSSAWGLFNAFDDLEKKQLSVERLQTRAAQASKNLENANAKLAKIAKEQGKGSAEYASQLKVVQLAQDKASQASKKAEIAAGDLNESYIQLGMTAGPMAAALAGSAAQLVSGLKGTGPAAAGAAKGMGGLAAASHLTVGGFKAAGIAAKGFLLSLGPIGIALIAIGALFTLYATNAFGFRDAVNAVGKSIIETVGAIVTAVTKAVNQVSSFLGGFLKDIVSGNVPQALERIRDMILGIYTKWIKPTFDQIFSFITGMLQRVASAFTGPIDAITKGVTDAVNTILRILSDLGQGFLDAFEALSSGAIIDAITAIGDAFTELGTMILDALTTLFTEQIPALIAGLTDIFVAEGKKWLDAIMGIIDGIIKTFAGVGKFLAEEAGKWLDSIMSGIGSLADLGALLGGDLAAAISGAVSIWDWGAAWESFINALKSTGEFLKNAFLASLNWIATTAYSIFQQIWDFLSSIDWPGAWKALQDAFWSTINFITTNAHSILSQVYDFIAGFDWNAAWKSLQDAFMSSVNFIVTQGAAVANTIIGSIVGGIKSGISQFQQIGQQIGSTLLAAITNILARAGNLAASISNAIKSGIGQFGQVGQQIGSTLLGAITNILARAGNLAQSIANAIKSGIAQFTQIGQQIGQTLLGAITNILTGAGDLAKGIADSIKSGISQFVEIGQDIANKIVGAITGFDWGNVWSTFIQVTRAEFTALGEAVDRAMKGIAMSIKDFSTDPLGFISQKFTDIGVALGLIPKPAKEAEESMKGTGKGAKEAGDAMTVEAFHAQTLEKKVGSLIARNLQFKQVIQETATTLRDEYSKSLLEANLKVQATNQMWNEGNKASQEYWASIQKVTLAEIDVTKALTNHAFANDLWLQGQIEGKQALADTFSELVKQAGALTETNKAWREMSPEVSASLSALQGFIAANIDVTASLGDTAYAQSQFNEGVISGREGLKDFIDGLAEGRGEYAATRSGLVDIATALGDVGDTSLLTIDQLKQFIGVVEGSPEALGNLASEIASLAEEARGFLSVADETKTLGANWVWNEDIPNDIKELFSKAESEMLAGQAQLARNMELLGPVIGEKFRVAIATMDLSSLREFGPRAAEVLRSGIEGSLGPAGEALATALEGLANVTEETFVTKMQNVVTAMENVNEPANRLTQQLIGMGNSSELTSKQLDDLVAAGVLTEEMANDVAAGVESMQGSLAGTASGLQSLFDNMDAVAGKGKELTFSLEELNKVNIEGVGQFAQIGDQLIQVKDAAGNAVGPLNGTGSALAGVGVDATDAHTKLSALHKILTLLPQVEVAPKINVDATEAHSKLSSLHKALTLLQGLVVTFKVAVDVATAKAGLNQINVAAKTTASGIAVAFTAAARKSMQNIAGIKAGFPPITSAANTAANKLASAMTSAVNKSISQINRLVSAMNRIPNINRQIRWTNRVVNSYPNPSNINRQIRWTNVMTNSAPRSEVPIDPMSSSMSMNTVDFSPVGTPRMVGTNGGNRGGGGTLLVQSNLVIDGKTLARVMNKYSMEDVGAY